MSHQPHQSAGPSPLEEAKDRVRIPELWRRLGWPGEPGKSCPCPYRNDKSPSGSVILPDGLLFHDFASGETFDGPALLARVEGLDPAAACKRFIGIASVLQACRRSPAKTVIRAAPKRSALPPRPELPEFLPLDRESRQRLAESRQVSVEAVNMACQIGLIKRCDWYGHPCWVVTDRSGWVAQIRRFDRAPFGMPHRTAMKAWTLKGCRAGWPVGIPEAAAKRCVAFVEGGPDLLAACHFIAAQGCFLSVAPVAMLGASARIVEDALPHFAGKRVRIFAHADPPKLDGGLSPGLEAAWRWQQQLTTAGATVDVFDLSGLRMTDGSPVKDLNDLTQCHPDDWQREAHELEQLMRF